MQTRITAEFTNGNMDGWPADLTIRTTANTYELGRLAAHLATTNPPDAPHARRYIIEADPWASPVDRTESPAERALRRFAQEPACR